VRSANHEANALAVANKLVHAAANNNENLARLQKTAPEKAEQIRAVILGIPFAILASANITPQWIVQPVRRSRLQEVIFGVVPQVMPLWSSFTLYRFGHRHHRRAHRHADRRDQRARPQGARVSCDGGDNYAATAAR
jgi:hypothetical protein